MRRTPSLHLFTLAAAVGCGETAPDGWDAARSAQPIVGGYVDDTTTGAVGLAIRIDRGFFAGHCSGALIAPNLVLTARHCVAATTGAADDPVECGETRFHIEGAGDLFFASPETERPWRLTPSFYRGQEVRPVPGADDICGFDLALIILEGEGIPPESATPLVPRVDARAAAAERFSALGYGLTDPADGLTAGVRMRVDDKTVRCAGQGCSTGERDVIRDTEWLSTDARVCPGDSGGPALDADGRVIGIASRGGEGCLSIIYSDVGVWGDFIIETALDAAEAGGYEPPFWTRGPSDPGTAEAAEEDEEALAEAILGTACTGRCRDGHLCFSEAGEPPGVCVPPCDRDQPSCPEGYACADALAACVPEGSSALSAPRSEKSSCSAGPRQAGAGGTLRGLGGLACLSLVWLARRRRRGGH